MEFKTWYEEIDLDELKNKPTTYLLKLRNLCYPEQVDYIYEEDKIRYENFKNFQNTVYEILSTREHVPNKVERKLMRIEKARLRKVGR